MGVLGINHSDEISCRSFSAGLEARLENITLEATIEMKCNP